MFRGRRYWTCISSGEQKGKNRFWKLFAIRIMLGSLALTLVLLIICKLISLGWENCFMWPKVVAVGESSSWQPVPALEVQAELWWPEGPTSLLQWRRNWGPRERDRLALSHLWQLSWNWAVASSLSKVFLILFLLSLAWHIPSPPAPT